MPVAVKILRPGGGDGAVAQMAQRVTGFARRPPAAPEAVVAAEPLPPPAAPSAPCIVPLELSALLAPYRRHGRLGVRVERLPRRARLTAGHNNGDRSWSLAPDELDGLAYMPPADMREPHALAIRIIRLDGGDAATLAVLDYPVLQADASARPAPGEAPGSDGAELLRLREDLAEAKAVVLVREAELAATRAARDAERDEKAASEAYLERSRAARQAEQEVRIAAAEARAQERVDQARQDATAELAKAEKSWKAAEAARLAAAEAQWQQKSAPARSDDAELRRLRDDLADAKASADLRASELTRVRAEQATARDQARRESEEALARAEKTWKAAEAARLAAAEMQWQQKSAHVRTDDGELRRLRDELAGAKASAAARESELARMRAEHAAAGDRAAREVTAALARAETDWRAAEAARLAAAEAQWDQKSRRALAEARFQIDAARQQSDNVELRRLRDALAEAETALAVSESELAQTRTDAETTREHLRREAEEALVRAGKRWKAGEAARLATAEAQWRQQSAGALAQAHAEAETARTRDDNTEIVRLRGDLAAVHTTLAAREAELIQARGSVEQERLQTEGLRGADAELRQAREALAALRTTLAEREAALSRARADADQANAQAEVLRDNDIEVRRLHDALAAMQAALSAREGELAQARAAMERERDSWRAETDAALSKAEKIWRAEQAARIAAAEAEGEERHAIALADMTARLKHAETALAETRAQADALRNRSGDVELRRLRRELSAMRAALTEREAELAQGRSALEQAQERWAAEARDTLRHAEQGWKGQDPEALEHERVQARRRMIRDIALVGAVAVLAVVFYLRGGAFFADWLPEIPGWTDTASATAPVPAKPQAPVAAQPSAVVFRAANVHSGPSKTAAVVAALPRGAAVVPVERRGNWVRVRFTADGKPAQQGWVFNTFLKDVPDKKPIGHP